MTTRKTLSFVEELNKREDLVEDLHEMIGWITAGIKWVAGTNSGMGVLEANAVKQAESMEKLADAVSTVGDGLGDVAKAIREHTRALTKKDQA